MPAEQKIIRIEFHCHTNHSADGLISPARLVEICRRKGIERIVVTDHNSTSGAEEAQRMDPERVIIGEEIMTQSGELLAAYVKEEVPAGLTALETIKILRGQGAFISVSHPFDIYRKGHWKMGALLEIAPRVDAIEVFNSRSTRAAYNWQARRFADEQGLLGTVGSDAHAASEVGMSTHLLPDFSDPTSLKLALSAGQEETRMSGFWVHFYSRYAKWVKNRG